MVFTAMPPRLMNAVQKRPNGRIFGNTARSGKLRFTAT